MQVKILVPLKRNTLTVLPHLQKALTKDRHNSGHRVVFDDKWQQNRPWLQNTDNAMIN